MGSPLGKQGQIVVALFMTSGFHSIALSNQLLFTCEEGGGGFLGSHGFQGERGGDQSNA